MGAITLYVTSLKQMIGGWGALLVLEGEGGTWHVSYHGGLGKISVPLPNADIPGEGPFLPPIQVIQLILHGIFIGGGLSSTPH